MSAILYPTQCVENGEIDKECLCKIWCAAGCGGAACNCISNNKDSSQTNLVNENACKERMDEILSKNKRN